MLCDLGGAIRRNDFTDEAASKDVMARTNHYLELFYEHALSEEQSIHSHMREFVPDIVDKLEGDHQAIEERGAVVKGIILELPDAAGPEQLIETGFRLHQAFNSYVAFFLEHLNYEEESFLPLTWQYFDDGQLADMRVDILAHNPPERNIEWLGGIFSSNNVNELAELVSGVQASPLPQEMVQGLIGLARNTVGEERWAVIEKKMAKSAA